MSGSIEPPPFPQYSFTNSKRRVYSGSSSRSLMDADVIEIPHPVHHPSNLMKQKEAILHDVIDIDNNEDSADLVFIGENVGKSNKGKTIEAALGGYGNHQVMEVFDDVFGPHVMDKFGPVSGAESSNGFTSVPHVMEKFGPGSGAESSDGFTSVPHNLINVDDPNSDQSCDDDDGDYTDLFSDDHMDVDQYAVLQSYFDNVDIPPGIEASIPLLAECDLGSKKTGSSSLHPWFHTHSDAKISNVTDSSQASWSLEPPNSEIQVPSVGSASLQVKMDAIDYPSGIELSSPQLFPQTAPGKKKSAASQRRRCKLKLSSKSQCLLGFYESEEKLNVFGASTNHGFVDNAEAMELPHGVEPPNWGQVKAANMGAGSSSLYHPNFIGTLDGSVHIPGIELANPWWNDSDNFKPFTNYTANSNFFHPFVPLHVPPVQIIDDNTGVNNSARHGNNGTAADSTVVTISDESREEILRKFHNFKQFDTVEDASDHHFVYNNSSMKQHPKNWAKRIQEEWKLLEKDLPDSIFVRVYESRIDLLRAVIIGAEGTPYHDGLFFFDVFFPSGYPNVPPEVHYHSGGLRLNPNLYNSGRVCLSLLNTWSGNKNEKWLPGVSTILQVLVSIQGLILNTKPYFNEPGYARLSGSASGEMKSLQYNEDTFLLSLRTMVYMIRRPPKNFEDFVVGHFCSRAHDILVACKAYVDGAQVGCLVKGGVQDVDQGDRSCSKQFKNSLTAYVDMLVREFTQIGAKDCEKFLSPSTAGNKPLAEVPEAATFS